MNKLLWRKIYTRVFWHILIPTALVYFVVLMLCYAIDKGV